MTIGVLIFTVAVGSVFCVSLLCLALPRVLQWAAAFVVPFLLAIGLYFGPVLGEPSQVMGEYLMWAPAVVIPAVLAGIPLSLMVVWLFPKMKVKY